MGARAARRSAHPALAPRRAPSTPRVAPHADRRSARRCRFSRIQPGGASPGPRSARRPGPAPYGQTAEAVHTHPNDIPGSIPPPILWARLPADQAEPRTRGARRDRRRRSRPSSLLSMAARLRPPCRAYSAADMTAPRGVRQQSLRPTPRPGREQSPSSRSPRGRQPDHVDTSPTGTFAIVRAGQYRSRPAARGACHRTARSCVWPGAR